MKHQTERIWLEFSLQLKHFIQSRVSDEFLADDILQDVFIKIHSRIETLKDHTKIRSWIYQIARNTIIDYFRNRKREPEIPANFPVFDQASKSRASHIISHGIRAMIEVLPEKYRQALIFTEYEGLRQKELAKRLGISLSGAKSRIQRARKKLKEMILEYCHFEFDRHGTIIVDQPVPCPYCTVKDRKKFD